ncbi:MAG: hypothetical protein HY331_10775 [Chloroflexi bacterium]|nr:hypothetical protein [Chloroflexota bacterium]
MARDLVETAASPAWLHGASGLGDELLLIGLAVVLGVVVLVLGRGGKGDDA